MTPDALALAIVRHYNPDGRILEPCAGDGAFLRAFRAQGLIHVSSYEITKGRDFLAMRKPAIPFNWIITNPPWSQFRCFLQKSIEVADNVVFLDKLNAWMSTRSRLAIIEAAGFQFVEIALVDQPPPPWPQMGFQFAAVHISRAKKRSSLGSPKISRICCPNPEK